MTPEKAKDLIANLERLKEHVLNNIGAMRAIEDAQTHLGYEIEAPAVQETKVDSKQPAVKDKEPLIEETKPSVKKKGR